MFHFCFLLLFFFFFKQKTAYEMRISDWSSDVCSSDLDPAGRRLRRAGERRARAGDAARRRRVRRTPVRRDVRGQAGLARARRSEEHTSELQSLMRISYAVFCLKKKKRKYQRIYSFNSSTTHRHAITQPQINTTRYKKIYIQ